MSLRRRGPVLPAALLIAALTAGCSADEQTVTGGAGSSAPPAASAPSPSDPVPPPSGAPAGASATPAPSAPTGSADSTAEPSGGPLTVVAVRVARQEGYDRVVLELAGEAAGAPGWQVAYEDDPRRDGSGEPVEVTGAAVLVVRVLGAGYPFDTGQVEASSVSVPGDTEVVQDVELGSVFEGTYEAFVGLRRQAPFTVTRLSSPARVVIDIEHP